jgi:hypothetical protein
MTKTNALPRLAGATVLSLLALAFAALVLSASSLAAPLPEGGDPALTVSPSPAVLPTTTVGNQSQTIEFELRNDSGEEAAVEKTILGGEDSGEFSFGGSNCGGLQPGEHCSAWIGFKPSSTGAKKTALHVTFAGGRPEQSFEVSGTSVAPHFSFQPGSYDFGLQPIHSESQRTTFTIENDGAAAAQVGSLNFRGNSNGFWFDNNSDCWGRWMAPGETCSLQVYFGPNDPGLYAAQIQLQANGENFYADLAGEGGRPIVEAFPNPADFGTATVGTASQTQAIVVHNSGNVATAFFIGIVAGGDAGSFHLLDESCSGAPLMPAGSCVAHVRFTPQSAGPKVARLAFFGDSEGGAMVTLSGEGVTAAVTLAPSGHDFGSTAAGAKSAPQSFAVRNEGDGSLDLASATIVGADLDQFSLSGDDCSGSTLAPGDECVVRIRFTPDSAGVKTARLRVSGDSGVFTAALTGIGVAAGGPGGNLPAGGAASSAAATFGQPNPPRRGRHRGRRPFSRGDAVTSARARARSSRRGDLRTSSVPR